VSESGAVLTAANLRNLVVRLIVAGTLLALVFRIALPRDGAGIFESIVASWHTGPLEAGIWFLIAFSIFGISFAIGASRFSILLRGAGFAIGWPSLFRAYLVAGFFNLVLPGAILGDVYRLWDVRREAGKGSRALGIIAVERLLGLSALGCLGLVAAPFIPLESEDRSLAWLLMGLCGVIALGTAGALHPVINGQIRRLAAPLRRVSQRIADALDGALMAVAELAERPQVLLRAFFLSLLNQGLPVAAVYCLAVPLAGSTSWYWFVIIVPFVTLVSLVPISVGGTGVREYFYITLFGAVGMPKQAALALALSLLGTAIVWALVGFAIFSVDRRSSRAATEPS
jgi:uncharacterized protein (TIRG00374 family)